MFCVVILKYYKGVALLAFFFLLLYTVTADQAGERVTEKRGSP